MSYDTPVKFSEALFNVWTSYQSTQHAAASDAVVHAQQESNKQTERILETVGQDGFAIQNDGSKQSQRIRTTTVPFQINQTPPSMGARENKRQSEGAGKVAKKLTNDDKEEVPKDDGDIVGVPRCDKEEKTEKKKKEKKEKETEKKKKEKKTEKKKKEKKEKEMKKSKRGDEEGDEEEKAKQTKKAKKTPGPDTSSAGTLPAGMHMWAPLDGKEGGTSMADLLRDSGRLEVYKAHQDRVSNQKDQVFQQEAEERRLRTTLENTDKQVTHLSIILCCCYNVRKLLCLCMQKPAAFTVLCMVMVYVVHCTAYLVQCTLYIVQCTLFIAQCMLYIAQCVLYIVQCVLYIVQCTLYIVQCTLHIVQWPQFTCKTVCKPSLFQFFSIGPVLLQAAEDRRRFDNAQMANTLKAQEAKLDMLRNRVEAERLHLQGGSGSAPQLQALSSPTQLNALGPPVGVVDRWHSHSRSHQRSRSNHRQSRSRHRHRSRSRRRHGSRDGHRHGSRSRRRHGSRSSRRHGSRSSRRRSRSSRRHGSRSHRRRSRSSSRSSHRHSSESPRPGNQRLFLTG